MGASWLVSMLTRETVSEIKKRQEGEFLPVLLPSLISFLIGKEVMVAWKGIMINNNMDDMEQSFLFLSIF